MAPDAFPRIARSLEEAHERFQALGGGALPIYIPQLAQADPARLALAVCTVDGRTFSVGDAEHRFTLQSCSKPFMYALALELHGVASVHARVGVEPTGHAFYSLHRLESGTSRPFNPMVNSGAIAVADLVRQRRPHDPTALLLSWMGKMAGRDDLAIDEAVFASEHETGHRNRAIAHLMRHFEMIETVDASLDLYFRQCSVLADVRDLAAMGATLAAGGRNPLTRRDVLPADNIKHVLTVMLTSGLYDFSGQWAFEVGLPGKSGVSGAILAVVPGEMALAVFAPPLDEKGNSVKGLAAMRWLSSELELHQLKV